MANESSKGSKKDRIRGKASHKQYNLMDVAGKNKVRRELKNMKDHPDDVDCYKRLCSYLTSGKTGMQKGKIEAVVAATRSRFIGQ